MLQSKLRPGLLAHVGVVHAGAMLWVADVTASVLMLGSENPTKISVVIDEKAGTESGRLTSLNPKSGT